ncbi:patatin-like phospholipase family protein [Tersicoccus sp. MR15.9]|uniref:patatin-like phospholipase family protein n=1 Tax=Tersicoccus mangrovi TaxID=3121635 RepID=UPI002FE5EB8A
MLGGGGSTGNAWLIGVIAGLAEAGTPVTDADRIIGTSAGSTAAAQITGTNVSDLLAAALTPAASPRPGSRQIVQPPSRAVTPHLERLKAIIAAAADSMDMRRRIGAASLEQAVSDGSVRDRWRATVASRLPSPDWPDREIHITAVDARTGEPVVFDRNSGVELVDAVAASCSNGSGVPPYRIGDRWYLDGGYRRNENADLGAGCARVLVLTPFGGRSLHPATWKTQLAAQVDELRHAGSAVEVLAPRAEEEHLFGANAMNPSLRPDAARAGFELGLAQAERLSTFWG